MACLTKKHNKFLKVIYIFNSGNLSEMSQFVILNVLL